MSTGELRAMVLVRWLEEVLVKMGRGPLVDAVVGVAEAGGTSGNSRSSEESDVV